MSRGGRGGGRGGRGGMHRNPLPFDVDLELVDGAEGRVTDDTEENKVKQLFPVSSSTTSAKHLLNHANITEQPINLVAPAPIKAVERQQVAIGRELIDKRKGSVFWTGSKEQSLGIYGAKVEGKCPIDAFDSMETYSKKKRAKAETFVPIDKRQFPKISECSLRFCK